MKHFYRITIGDGMNETKDFDMTLARDVIPMDEEFRMLVTFVLRPTFEEERLIDDAEIDSDDNEAVMVINEGPAGECAPNSRAWLVARITEVAR